MSPSAGLHQQLPAADVKWIVRIACLFLRAFLHCRLERCAGAGLNVALYWQNTDMRKYVNIVPTSAITGEGLPDMLQLLVKLTQARSLPVARNPA